MLKGCRIAAEMKRSGIAAKSRKRGMALYCGLQPQNHPVFIVKMALFLRTVLVLMWIINCPV